MALTPLQLIAGQGLLQNQGIAINANLSSTLNTYNAGLVAPLREAIINAPGKISPGVIAQMQTIGTSTVPALSNSVPPGYGFTPAVNPPGYSGFIVTTSNTYLGNGDTSKFAQALNIAEGYISFTDQILTSAINSQTYLADTFTNMSNMITGDIALVTTNPQLFGEDLANLNYTINLQKLNDLGSPALLLYNLSSQMGVTPSLQVALNAVGIPGDIVLNVNDPRATVSDTVQRLMYNAMTKVTGVPLTNILSALKITTPGLTTLADLLNPVKIFPNSYQTLTVITVNGQLSIYVPNSTSVNTELEKLLPPYFISSIV